MAELVVGRRYAGTTTGKRNGRRIFTDREFVAARSSVEEFVRVSGVPAQDRVFIDYDKFGAVPALFVAGSIREVP